MTKRLMTAEELDLSQAQYCGLVKTLEALESGKLDHENEHTAGFDMQKWGGRCGAVCCLGGTAEVLGECNFDRNGMEHRAFGIGRGRASMSQLDRLFYPTHAGSVSHRTGAWKASTKQAAVALRHYLMTGKENWKMAMETPR